MKQTFIQLLSMSGVAIVALLVNLTVIPRLIKLAHKKEIVDLPGKRKVHHNPIAILGGLGIMITVLIVGLFFQLYSLSGIASLFGIAFFMGFVGLYDDVMDVEAKKKFAIQLGVGVLLYYSGFQLNNFHGLMGYTILPEYLGLPLTVLAFAGICNAINLIDGVDGLLTGLSGLYALFFTLFFWSMGVYNYALFTAVLLGAITPAFIFNVFGTKNKLFMGDCGSLFLGVLFFGFTAKANQLFDGTLFPLLNPIVLWIALLSVPVFDTLRVMFCRMLKGRSPFTPDKTHLHHILLRFNFSHKRVSFYMVLINLAAMLSGIILALTSRGWMQLVTVVLSCMLLVYFVPAIYYICVERYDLKVMNRTMAIYRRRRMRKAQRDPSFIRRIVR